MRASLSLIGAALFAASGCGSSSKSPTGFEALPTTIETVQAAVDMVTTGHVDVAAACNASPAVNCPGGTPGSPIPLNLTRTSLSITPTSALVYSYAAQVTIVSAKDIPLTLPIVGPCTAAVNTTAGSSPTVQVSGTATFGSHSTNTTIDQVTLTVQLSGLEAADITISGAAGCTVANFGSAYFLGLLNQTLANSAVRFCGAPGPQLLVACLVASSRAEL